jgi:GH15 family glucan-1,4-alpha-glucosidase
MTSKSLSTFHLSNHSRMPRSSKPRVGTPRIEDYALIGDCESAALISREGSIDWLCWPRFDSDACFAALLGKPENGRWSLRPVEPAIEHKRSYRDETLILETWVRTASGTVRVVDFMPPHGSNSDIVRLVIGEQGTVRMRTELTLRFDYGATVPWVTRIGEGEWSAIAGPHMTILRTPAPMRGENLHSVAEFDVHAGETIPFTLTYAQSHLSPPERIDEQRALADTERFWRDWAAKCECLGEHREIVIRSLLTLRALIYAPTGGIVAAPTTSLPEQLGGTRNWDYRYCWLRDATLTLLALMNGGYSDEAAAWRDWLVRAVAGSPSQMQIMYGVAGERRLSEWEVPWLEGYEGSAPVRIGNGAHAQLQLDVYGEVMDALHQARQGGLQSDEPAWAMQLKLLEHVASVWREPDYGMWEIRSEPRHFTYSKIMTWVAFDRAIKSAERFSLAGPIDEWRRLRAEIHADVLRNGFDAERNTFVQSYGSKSLDASLLLIPGVGFLPASDSRVQGTVAAIERGLMRDGFVLRYDTAESDDGLPAGEGAFLACSFWLADAYAMCGRLAEAKALFERLIALRSDLGLLAEEYDVTAKRQVGNFPQAFSHVALLNTAYNLARKQKPAEQRSERSVPA